jgi:hypothetical protein
MPPPPLPVIELTPVFPPRAWSPVSVSPLRTSVPWLKMAPPRPAPPPPWLASPPLATPPVSVTLSSSSEPAANAPPVRLGPPETKKRRKLSVAAGSRSMVEPLPWMMTLFVIAGRALPPNQWLSAALKS